MWSDVRTPGDRARVDFATHAAALGCYTRRVATIDGLAETFDWARTTDRTTVIVIATDPHAWTEGGAWWEVGVPEVSKRPSIQRARAELDAAKRQQRRGV
jgi:3D-(3,5/4)-trihydroxycyclohexane-1,2-dione acylhydrolase (decyclizing)